MARWRSGRKENGMTPPRKPLLYRTRRRHHWEVAKHTRREYLHTMRQAPQGAMERARQRSVVGGGRHHPITVAGTKPTAHRQARSCRFVGFRHLRALPGRIREARRRLPLGRLSSASSNHAFDAWFGFSGTQRRHLRCNPAAVEVVRASRLRRPGQGQFRKSGRSLSSSCHNSASSTNRAMDRGPARRA